MQQTVQFIMRKYLVEVRLVLVVVVIHDLLTVDMENEAKQFLEYIFSNIVFMA